MTETQKESCTGQFTPQLPTHSTRLDKGEASARDSSRSPTGMASRTWAVRRKEHLQQEWDSILGTVIDVAVTGGLAHCAETPAPEPAILCPCTPENYIVTLLQGRAFHLSAFPFLWNEREPLGRIHEHANQGYRKGKRKSWRRENHSVSHSISIMKHFQQHPTESQGKETCKKNYLHNFYRHI